MKTHRISPAVLALLLVVPAGALADEPAAPASMALLPFDPAGGLFSAAGPRLDLGVPVFDAVAWVPRVPPASDPPPAEQESYPHHYHRYRDGYTRSSPVQLHGGFFDPNGGGSNSFAFGFRGGPAVDENIQLGLGVDWYHQSQDQRDVVGQTVQAGQPVTVTRELAHASSDLMPLMAFLQFDLGSGQRGIVPYAGIAGEYQVLFLSATDFQTRADYNATFGGWGWQAWGGAALPLSRRSRLFGEAFWNSGEVGRDVNDPVTGVAYRETIDAGGVGARFGLSWGF